MAERKYGIVGERPSVTWPWQGLETTADVLETCKRYINGFFVYLQRTNPELYREIFAYFEEESDLCVRNLQAEYEFPELMGYPAVARYVEQKYPELVPEISKHINLANERKIGVLEDLNTRTLAVIRLLDFLRESDPEAYHDIRLSFRGFGPDISSRNAVEYIQQGYPHLIPIMTALVEQAAQTRHAPTTGDDFDA